MRPTVMEGVTPVTRSDSFFTAETYAPRIHPGGGRRADPAAHTIRVQTLASREAIPGLSHGLKVARARRVDLELPAKLHHVHVDGARHHVRRISPDLAQ